MLTTGTEELNNSDGASRSGSRGRSSAAPLQPFVVIFRAAAGRIQVRDLLDERSLRWQGRVILYSSGLRPIGLVRCDAELGPAGRA